MVESCEVLKECKGNYTNEYMNELIICEPGAQKQFVAIANDTLYRSKL